MQDFRKLKIWQRSHQLVLKIYSATKTFPAEERYGIISQIRRSSASIPTNIAEGTGRRGNVEFARFIEIAFSSASEVQYQLILSKDLDYLSSDKFRELSNEIVEIKRMLTSFLNKLKTEN
jgi:four helix bundle protein